MASRHEALYLDTNEPFFIGLSSNPPAHPSSRAGCLDFFSDTYDLFCTAMILSFRVNSADPDQTAPRGAV